MIRRLTTPKLSLSRIPAPADVLATLAEERKTLAADLKSQQDARDGLLRSIPAALVMKEREEVRPAHIMVRGAYDQPGEEVTRDVPGFLPPMKKQDGLKTRMDLAEWFIDPANPLTARVAVNRFWQQFFGVGLVKTSEDFGSQGESPSHPELLDHLAIRFVESGWDVKETVRSIVLSQTYQQSSTATPDQYRRRPGQPTARPRFAVPFGCGGDPRPSAGRFRITEHDDVRQEREATATGRLVEDRGDADFLPQCFCTRYRRKHLSPKRLLVLETRTATSADDDFRRADA